MTAARLSVAAVLLLGALVLVGAAWLRGAEYDEQYTVFLLAGDARPAWPEGVFAAGDVRDRFHGSAGPMQIAADLRRTDVHPPLYFWAVAGWGRVVGDSLFRLRLFSVLCGLGALGVVGLIAHRIGVPVALAILLTLGCYAFAYTGSVARGFALAQVLALLGAWLALTILRHPRRRPRTHAFLSVDACEGVGGRPPPTMTVGMGLLLGAASFANYLAAFTAAPVLLWLAWRRPRDGVLAGVGFAVFVAADLVFFLAQRDSRPGQFPPFHLVDGLARLGKYTAGSLAGGLPMYVPAPLAAPVAAGTAILLAALTVLVAARWRRIGTPDARVLLAGAVVATPAGLLLLGLAFDNTPIELRYLAFATPYAALLLAGALAALPRCAAAVLALQTVAIAGLLLRPETMQPMRDAANEAARLADAGSVVLLPRGNDGVGVVGAFVTEAPDDLRLLLVGPGAGVAAVQRVAPRLILPLLARDADSRATVAALQAGFAHDPCWRTAPGAGVAVFERVCPAAQAVAVSTAR